jgi:hypothetical protein
MSMTRDLLALAAGFCTNIVGYVVALIVLNFSHAETPSALWVLAPMLWLASMILGGWATSVVARSRRFLLGYLAAFLGMLAVVLVIHVSVPVLATAVGLLIVSMLGALGALTYSRK